MPFEIHTWAHVHAHTCTDTSVAKISALSLNEEVGL